MISQQQPVLSGRLLSHVLGASLALSLVTPKGFGLLLGLFLVIGLLALQRRELAALRWQDGIFLVLLNAYPVMVALSMLLHGSWDVSLFDNASRFLLLGVGYVALRAKSFDLGYVVIGAMIGCGLTGGAGLLHQVFGVTLLQSHEQLRYGGFENPVVFAQILFFLLLVAVTPIKLACLSKSQTRGLLISVILLASIGVVVSESRSVLFALLVLCGYLLCCDSRLSSTRATKAVVMLSAIYAVFILVNSAHLPHLSGTASELMGNYEQFDQRTAMGQRLSQWSLSWELIVKQPAFGYGIGQFEAAFNGLPGADSLTEKVRSYSHAHNDFLQIAVEQGLVGLTIFVSALSAIVFMTVREAFAAAARHLLLVTMAGWLFFALTQTQLAHQKTTMMFAFLLALGFSHGMSEKYGSLNRSSA
ncbi:O-antigen ligase family protein [Congregibacter sp.]|uniref:O-antigen ligase family protein n=1 Tax=Congregibacter sp. TaxID=2744308 RepID=UPI003F6C6A3C